MTLDAPAGTIPKNIVDVHSESVPLNAVDVFVPRVGFEYELGQFELRAGYFYRPTPIPTQVYQTNFVDSDAHVVTLGAAWTFRDSLHAFRKPVTLGLGLQWTWLRPRRVDKALPNDPTGNYMARGSILSLGFDLQHDF
jgi:long-subunit fatty acid transport protein